MELPLKIRETANFIQTFIGRELKSTPIQITRGTPDNLPIWAERSAAYYQFKINGHKVWLIDPNTDLELDQVRNLHRLVLTTYEGLAVILADHLQPKARGVLARMGLAHVVRDKIIFIPELAALRRETIAPRKAVVATAIHSPLSNLGVKIAAAFLLNPEKLEKKFTLTELQKILSTLKMTVPLTNLSRACIALKAHGILLKTGAGRTHALEFLERDLIWNLLWKTRTDSDLIRTIEISTKLPNSSDHPWVYSGDSALALLTDLSPPRIPTIAMPWAEFWHWKKSLTSEQDDQLLDAPTIHVQSFRGDPRHLCLEAKNCVNPIELALSMKHDDDPRIQLSLAQLLAQYELRISGKNANE